MKAWYQRVNVGVAIPLIAVDKNRPARNEIELIPFKESAFLDRPERICRYTVGCIYASNNSMSSYEHDPRMRKS